MSALGGLCRPDNGTASDNGTGETLSARHHDEGYEVEGRAEVDPGLRLARLRRNVPPPAPSSAPLSLMPHSEPRGHTTRPNSEPLPLIG